MPRARSPARDKAKKMYIDSGGHMLLKDIAASLKLSDTQIRKWKSQDKWDDELKGNVTIPLGNVTKASRKLTKEEKQTLCNDDLSDKQRLFCLYYIKLFNATKAYMKAFNVDYFSAAASASRLMRNDKIRLEIQRLKEAKMQRSLYTYEDLFQKMLDIAYADINDYLDFGQDNLVVDGVEIPNIKTNVINLKESDTTDGTLIDSIAEIKGGVSIKLIDRKFALKWLSDNIGLANKEQKAKIDLIKAQTHKIIEDEEEIENVDDGFMEALNGTVKEDWDEYEEEE